MLVKSAMIMVNDRYVGQKRAADKNSFIFMVLLAGIEFDCWMNNVKPPTQRFFEYIEKKFKR